MKTATKNSGRVMRTKHGHIGIVYNNEDLVNGKRVLHVCDPIKFEPQGDKLLCYEHELTVIGYTD